MLAVYKSCIKSRENEPRHDFNATYAQIINQSEVLNPNENIYPPPPPPYGYNPTYTDSNTTTGLKPETTNELNEATNTENINNINNINNNNGWSSYITGASVGNIRSYLFSRTK